MKQLKRVMLILLCAGAVMGVTACGTDQGTEDRVNDATEHTGENGGTLDEAGDEIRDDIDEIGDDIRDDVDDLADDDTAKNN